MEHHRTRPQHHGPRRGRPPLPSQGERGQKERAVGGRSGRPAPRRPPAVRRPAPASAAGPALRHLRHLRRMRRIPNPRLTGLGGGLFCGTVMFTLGCLDQLVLGGSPTAYGVLFLLVCVLTAVWVRKGDLLTSPVVVPIAFALGLLPVADRGGGLAGRLMGLVTALATQAGWLYGGTLLAGVTAMARRILLVRHRRRA
ncbi:DUF6542 domain-containing protein [Streptomyces sp. NPDC005202]|uniref:DUF6542 domain-containing protein n=1 Tax=Streptomyces sp. NPDC005202 TaxID=3157021 RepID=UPI0033AF70F6